MDEEKKELVPIDDVKEEYVIHVKGGGKIREIRLSAGMFKAAVWSIIFALMALIGTGGYSVYSAMNVQRNAAIVREIQQAEELQQEQILNVSKKAAELSETLHNLTQQEQELRIQAGLKPPKEDKPADEKVEEKPAEPAATPEESAKVEESQPAQVTEKVTPKKVEPSVAEFSRINHEPQHNGQGGPVENLTVDEVSEALAMLEVGVNLRKESLDDFQAELKQQREQLAVAAAGATGTSPVPNFNGAATWSASTEITFDLSQFGGIPAADSHMPSIWPTTGVVTSPYGLRWGGSDFHPGIDIANDMGTPIVATADGVVDYAGWNAGGYGNMVDIDHGNGIMTRYGHASQVVVSAGQHVKRGQLIAYMGSTGFSTGPHCHYEVIINGQKVNPISYL